jgi:Zn-dependent alcohol dehydrogenase
MTDEEGVLLLDTTLTIYLPLNAIPSHIEFLKSQRQAYHSLMDHIYSLDELQGAFAEFCAGQSLKPLIKP